MAKALRDVSAAYRAEATIEPPKETEDSLQLVLCRHLVARTGDFGRPHHGVLDARSGGLVERNPDHLSIAPKSNLGPAFTLVAQAPIMR